MNDQPGRPPATRVTLITPTYNHARFLAETVASVLAQTYSPIDYVVIDDGSTDDTAAVLDAWRDRVTVIDQANAGQATTLNRGWNAAHGEYLGYLSSDDTLVPTAIAELVAVLDADPGIVCVFPDCDLIDPASVVIKRNVCRPFDLERLVIEQECHIGPGALFRADAFRAVGGWRSELRLAPDREFWMRLAARGKFRFLTKSLAGYRSHPGSISYKEVSEETSREYLRVLDDYFKRPDVPAPIRARRDEAYGRAYYLIARNCFRALNMGRGLANYVEACRLHPPLRGARAWLGLVRTTISKPLRLIQGHLLAVARRA